MEPHPGRGNKRGERRGLNIELLHEFDYTKFARWPILEKSGFDTYRLPEGTPSIPLMYSLRARKA